MDIKDIRVGNTVRVNIPDKTGKIIGGSEFEVIDVFNDSLRVSNSDSNGVVIPSYLIEEIPICSRTMSKLVGFIHCDIIDTFTYDIEDLQTVITTHDDNLILEVYNPDCATIDMLPHIKTISQLQNFIYDITGKDMLKYHIV